MASLPSHVMAGGEPAWVTDIGAEPALERAEVARAAGLRAGFAFPILIGTRPAGVLEFFTAAPAAPDPALLHVMGQIGVQLGRVVERERARGELERSNADLEAFAYVASHDLAEPLRSVAGFVALLERQYGDRLDDRAREFIAYAVDGVERMQRMIDDLLLYARAGTADLRMERVAAGDLVAAALRDLGTAVAERGAVVEVGELPTLRGDPGQLQRVFQNLLGNAIKYTAPGVTPRVVVSGATRRRRRGDRRRRQRDRHRPRAGRAGVRDVRAHPRSRRAVPGNRARAGHLAADRRNATAGASGWSPTPAVAACSGSRSRYRRERSSPLPHARLRRPRAGSPSLADAVRALQALRGRARDCPGWRRGRSERRGDRAAALAVALVGADRVVLLEGQRDVVEAVEQPVLDLRIDVEAARCPPAPADLLLGEVDLRLAAPAAIARTSSSASSTGSSPIFVQLERKMSAKLGAMIARKP